MNAKLWLVAMALVIALSGTSNSERVRGIEFAKPGYELVGWLSYESDTPLLHLPFQLPSGEMAFDYPARLETRTADDGIHRVTLTFAAGLDLKEKSLSLEGWDKNNKVIPGTASKVQKLAGTDIMLVNAELIRSQEFRELHRLVLISTHEGKPAAE